MLAGVALFEVALIPGMVINAAAVLPALQYLRRRRLQPLFNSTARQRSAAAVPLPDRPVVNLPLAPARFGIKQGDGLHHELYHQRSRHGGGSVGLCLRSRPLSVSWPRVGLGPLRLA